MTAPDGVWESGTPFPPDPEAADAQTESRLSTLRGRLLDSPGLAKVTPLEPLVDGFLFANSLAWLTGRRANCKSFVALDMAGCVGTGQPWQGRAVKPGRVLYVVGEGMSGMPQRVRAWEHHYQTDMTGVTFLPGPLHLIADQAALALITEDAGASLVVFDTQNMVTVGTDENSSKDMGMILAAVERIRDASHACCLMVHHEAINGEGRPRGHSSMDGAATTLLRCVKDGEVVWVGNTKQKDGPQHPTMGLLIKASLDSLVLVMDDGFGGRLATDSEQIIYKCVQDISKVKGGVSNTELRDEAMARGVPQSTYYWAMKRLVAAGLIRGDGKGRARLFVAVHPGQATIDADKPEE